MCGSRGRVVNIMTSENTNSAGSSAAHIKSVESLDQSNEMERGLKNRHVQFIAIGGTIGTGLFLGSGKSIALTGPSIIFVYIGVGLIMFLLMRAIGEMMYSDPSQHTFINFITRYLGRGWGKFAGWTYWIVLILTGMTEITAVSTYFVTFFGTFGIDLNSWKWLIELCFLVALTGINLIAVKVFGEAEFWFSMIKITLIVGLIVTAIVMLIIGFSYFYATMQFNPIEVANNLKKNGGFIPGFRPGKPTADFITKVLNKITMFGALYLSVIAIAPIITGNLVGYSSLAIGGTSVIIVVGVALETVKQLEAQMLMRHYKGFLE